MCAYLGFSVIVAFCYHVLHEPCDGFSDLLPVLLEYFKSLLSWNFLFLNVIYGLKIAFSSKELE